MIQNLNFNKYYKLFNIISVVLVTLSIISILFKGLNYGVDFKGGTLIELRINDNQTTISNLRTAFNNMNLGDVAIKNFGNDNDYLIKFVKKDRDKNLIQNIKKDLQSSIGPVFEFRRVESVGPKVSAELLNKGLIAIAASLGAMLFYIWIRFEWQFSLGAIIALFHDVILTIGIFSLFNIEINLSIVAALLTIVGYSMNDTVVIFDRVRENLKKQNLDAVITPTKNLELPLLGSFVKGADVIPKLINKFNPKYILSSTVGGDAKYSGFLNKFISVQDYEEELNCNLVDLKSMQSIMI